MKQRIEAKVTAQAINMPHQTYIVKQMNVRRGYNGSGREQNRTD